MMQSSAWGLFLWFMSSLCCATSSSWIAITNNHHTQQTHIMLTVSGSVTPHVFTLRHPDRLVIDVPQANTVQKTSTLARTSDVIRDVRVGHPHASTLRWVFDLRAPVMSRTARALTSKKKNIWQITLQKQKHISTKPSSRARPSHVPVYVQHMPPHALRDVVVVLDPGHGGKDPGAIGPRHTMEKNVVLSMARLLKQKIDRQPGMRAVLTRNGDYYVGLRQRLTIARRNNADVFIAIHADAVENHQSYGASVFALSQRGATSEAARWLAAKENYSELGGVQLSHLHDQNGIVRTVLIDLSQTATIGASVQMGSHVLNHLNTMTSLHHHRVEQARFVVLKSPDIPSILIETGFISNPREEKNLTNARYQDRLTHAMFDGIKKYFWSAPPHGTRLEAMINTRTQLAQLSR